MPALAADPPPPAEGAGAPSTSPASEPTSEGAHLRYGAQGGLGFAGSSLGDHIDGAQLTVAGRLGAQLRPSLGLVWELSANTILANHEAAVVVINDAVVELVVDRIVLAGGLGLAVSGYTSQGSGYPSTGPIVSGPSTVLRVGALVGPRSNQTWSVALEARAVWTSPGFLGGALVVAWDRR